MGRIEYGEDYMYLDEYSFFLNTLSKLCADRPKLQEELWEARDRIKKAADDGRFRVNDSMCTWMSCDGNKIPANEPILARVKEGNIRRYTLLISTKGGEISELRTGGNKNDSMKIMEWARLPEFVRRGVMRLK